MTTSNPTPGPLTYAQARINADAVEVVNAFRAGLPSHRIVEMMNQAMSPNHSIAIRLAEMVAALGTALAQAHDADPAEAFATWAAEAFDAVEQFDAPGRTDEGGGDQ